MNEQRGPLGSNLAGSCSATRQGQGSHASQTLIEFMFYGITGGGAACVNLNLAVDGGDMRGDGAL
ncbi:MAG TPA: hypothetical protein VKB35_00045, partial [Ktedonobacteraceae bacterium]|nr:hypothetical protein [Ktedonobacteraceae bacterium]